MDDFENQIKKNIKYKYTRTRPQIEMVNCYHKIGLEKICKETGKKEDLVKDYILGKKKVPEILYLFICDVTGCEYDYLIENSEFRTEKEKIDTINELNNMIDAGKKAEKMLKKVNNKDIYALKDKRKEDSKYPHKGLRPQIAVEKMVSEKGIKYVANIFNLNESTVYNYKSGRFNVPKKLFPIIEKETGASVDYLLGTTNTYYRDVRKAELEKEIALKQKELDCLNDRSENLVKTLEGLHHIELITNSALDGLNKLKLNIDSGISEIDTDIKPLNEDYADIVSHIISDVNLWTTLIETAERLITTKTDVDKLVAFENKYNRNIDIGYTYATGITPDEDAELRIKKAFINCFFNYITMKEKEIGLEEIDLDEVEQKQVWEILKHKNQVMLKIKKQLKINIKILSNKKYTKINNTK